MIQAALVKNAGFWETPQPTEVAGQPPPQLSPTLVEHREEITAGSVLLKNGTALPFVLHMSAGRFGDWEVVSGLDGSAIDRKLRQSGWHFSFIVPAAEANAIGLDPQKTVARALRRITRAVEARGFNAVEVTAIRQKKRLGIQWVSITAHPRDVHNSPFIGDLRRTAIPASSRIRYTTHGML